MVVVLARATMGVTSPEPLVTSCHACLLWHPPCPQRVVLNGRHNKRCWVWRRETVLGYGRDKGQWVGRKGRRRKRNEIK